MTWNPPFHACHINVTTLCVFDSVIFIHPQSDSTVNYRREIIGSRLSADHVHMTPKSKHKMSNLKGQCQIVNDWREDLVGKNWDPTTNGTCLNKFLGISGQLGWIKIQGKWYIHSNFDVFHFLFRFLFIWLKWKKSKLEWILSLAKFNHQISSISCSSSIHDHKWTSNALEQIQDCEEALKSSSRKLIQ